MIPGKQCQFQPGGYADFIEDRRDVVLYGLVADGELLCDVLIAATSYDFRYDLQLTRRQAKGRRHTG